ncbi:hypothetical protein ACQKC1_08950 [Shewanella baltica]|uniref:hypothetical protein n=1 Tax=Shewanella baltica TaxID=62322 RepID=UPI003CFD1209
MKQRPIIFNTEMVQAIVDGRKTQTRRAITDKQLSLFKCAASIGECHYLDDDINPKSMGYYRQFCQFGEVGDQLYVRETWRLFNSSNECGCSESPCSCPANGTVLFKATGDSGESKWKPSIHMPRSCARILLEVTAVRVERLNEISEQDAKAEGLQYSSVYQQWGGVEKHSSHKPHSPHWRWYKNPQHAFKSLWNSIYENWDANPWVWVIEFKVISTTGGAA